MASSKAERQKAGLYPSADIEVEDALKLYEWNWFRFSKSCENLDEARARGVLEALKKNLDAGVVFIATAIDEANFLDSWKAALVGLKRLDSLANFGSAEKRKQLESIAQNPRLVSAAQAAAVFDQRTVAKLELLAVLMLDGSEASMDALIPSVELALKSDATRFKALKRFANKSPGMEALFAKIETASEQAKSASEVGQLAAQLELKLDNLNLIVPFVKNVAKQTRLEASSWEQGRAFQLSLNPGRRPNWLAYCGEVHLVEGRVQVGSIAEPKPSVSLTQLPAWLSAQCRENQIQLHWEMHTLFGLRSTKAKATFLAWIRGEPH
jgi:hypothetical protein